MGIRLINLKSLVLVFLMVWTPAVLADENSGTGWAFKTLDLEMTFDPETQTITATGRAVLVLEEEASFGPTLALNLNSTLSLRKEIMRFTALEAGGEADISFNLSPEDDSHKNANATRLADIRYPAPFETGDEIEVRFTLESVDQAFQFKMSETNAVASYEAAWYPVPVSGPNQTESRLRRAKGTMTFHLPPGIFSFSNGILVEHQETAEGTTEVWALETPRARSFVLGPFQRKRFVRDGKEFSVYLLPDENRPQWTRGQVIPAEDMLEGLASAIDILEAAYGPFPFESFGVVEVPNTLVNWWGALEDGYMIATSGSLSSGRIGVLDNISHEVSHAWWGANVEPEGPGAYLLSESIANFSNRYFMEKYIGPELATHLFRFGTEGPPIDFNYSAFGYFNQVRNGKDAPLSGLISGNADSYNLASAKGGLFYNLLRNRVNDDELFFSVLRDFQTRFGGGEATLEDLREAFLKAAPEDLKMDRFLSQWLDGTGAPKLVAEFSTLNETEVEVIIRQVQEAIPFHLVVDLDLYVNGAPVRHTVEIDGRETRLVLETEGEVRGLVLDPGHKLLIWSPEYGPYQ